VSSCGPAEPGIRTCLDLPMIIGRAVLRRPELDRATR
jgi:hypothetical protein